MRRAPTQFLYPVAQDEFERVYGGALETPDGCRVQSWHQAPDGRLLGCVLCWSEKCWGIVLLRREALGIWCACRWSSGLMTNYAADLLLQIAARQWLEPV
jgi:hypothetical protein